MTSKRLLQVVLSLVLLFVIGLAIYFSTGPTDNPFLADTASDTPEDPTQSRTPREPFSSPRTDGKLDSNSGDVIAGGVERPKADLPRSRNDVGERQEGRQEDVGRTPAIDPDANEQVALAVEAVRTGAHPERLSPMHPPKTPFDREAYSEDNEARAEYLRTPQPGRVFAPAQPGPGVPRIRGACNPYSHITQGEWIILRVQAVPGMPVTFTSFDMGEFENRLTSITVEADSSGFAHAPFTAPPGTFGPVRIMAASPVTSGQVNLTVNVAVPQSADQDS